MNNKHKAFAIDAPADSMLLNPKMAATIAKMKNPADHRNIKKNLIKF